MSSVALATISLPAKVADVAGVAMNAQSSRVVRARSMADNLFALLHANGRPTEPIPVAVQTESAEQIAEPRVFPQRARFAGKNELGVQTRAIIDQLQRGRKRALGLVEVDPRAEQVLARDVAGLLGSGEGLDGLRFAFRRTERVQQRVDPRRRARE